MSRYLNLKLVRDLRQHWRQFVAVLLMAFLTVLVYSGLEGAWNGLRQHLDRYAADTSLADVWISLTPAQDDMVDRILGVEGVDIAEEVRRVQVAASLTTGDAHLDVELLPDRPGTLSAPTVVDGDAPGDGGAFWLGAPFAEAHGIEVGDTVALTLADRAMDVQVAGTYLSPERMYFTGTPSLVAPAPDLYGYALLRPSTASDGPDLITSTTLRLATDGTDEVTEAVADAAGDRLLRVTDRATNDSVATAFDRVGQIQNLSVLFSFIFVLLAVLAMYSSMGRLVEMQSLEIATLKALGVARRQIAAHFAMYGLVAGGGGALLGLAAAPAMSSYVLGTQQSMVSMPDWGIAYSPVPVLVVVVVAAACVVGALLATRPALRGNPADQLRPGVGRGRRIFLERAAGLWRRTGYGSRWAWRDSGTNPARSVMGVVAAAGSLMLLFAGFGMADSMHGQVRSAFEEENRYGARVALAPGASAERLLDDAGGGQLVQETVVRTSPSDGFDRVLSVVDDGDFLHLETVEGHPADLALTSVTEATASRLGVHVGDDVELLMPAGAARWCSRSSRWCEAVRHRASRSRGRPGAHGARSSHPRLFSWVTAERPTGSGTTRV